MGSQIINVKPCEDNVIAFSQFKAQYLSQALQHKEMNYTEEIALLSGFSDHMILFGGGREFQLTVLDLESPQGGPQIDNVELFVLNNGIVIWFNCWNHGVSIPYQDVIYHAAHRNPNEREGHRLNLMLTLECDDVLDSLFTRMKTPELRHTTSAGATPSNEPFEFTMNSIELTFRPHYSTFDRYYNDYVEQLFTFANVGVNRGDEMVNNCNRALAICLDIHGHMNLESVEDIDPEDTTEFQPQIGSDKTPPFMRQRPVSEPLTPLPKHSMWQTHTEYAADDSAPTESNKGASDSGNGV